MGNAFKLLVVVAVCLLGCQRDEAAGKDAHAPRVIRIVGSSTMAPLVSELARVFQAAHPDVRIQVESGGSGRGISEARAGTADIGMASRALTENERDLLGFSIARDGVGVVVHAQNPVSAATSAQVVEIFTGRVTGWQALGGAAAPISVVTRPEGRGSFELFTQHFRLKGAQIVAASSAAENTDAIKAVADDPNAVSFMSLGDAERHAGAGTPIKLLAIDGIAATSENIRTGRYPLSRPLTLVTRSLPSGAAKTFIDFALSAQASPIVRRYDFVPYLD